MYKLNLHAFSLGCSECNMSKVHVINIFLTDGLRIEILLFNHHDVMKTVGEAKISSNAMCFV